MLAKNLTRLIPCLIMVCFAGCGEKVRPNFILISIDTLRADHLGCYGYTRETSPVIDNFAEESLLYTDCLAPAPWTLPSHFAMLSGQHPHDNGILSANSAIGQKAPMLAELLQREGYNTAAFVDSRIQGYVGGQRGFDRGFNLYRHAPFHQEGEYEHEMAETAAVAVDWLNKRDRDQPFFLFLHTYSVHTTMQPKGRLGRRYPYSKPEPYVSRFLTEPGKQIFMDLPESQPGLHYVSGLNAMLASGELKPEDIPDTIPKALCALYDGGIYYMDEHLGRVLVEVDRLGLQDNTVVIITADHGEAFLEHRLFLHVELYLQLLRVPLIVRLPGHREGIRLDHPVSLVDIPPTLLDLAGIPIPDAMSGQSLPLIPVTKIQPRPRFSCTGERGDKERKNYNGFSLRLGPWSLIQHRFADDPIYVTELYNDQTDPAESSPLEDPKTQKALMDRLKNRIAQKGEEEMIELNEETIEYLRGLGYIK